MGLKDKTYVFSYSGADSLDAGSLVREFTSSIGGGGGGPKTKGEGAAPLREKEEIEKALNDIRQVVG